MKKRILVTGGAGFIGSNLCERLIELGSEVVCVDNLTTGNVDNLKKIMKNSGFTFIKHDINVPLKLEDNFDLIFNLACPASPRQYQANPLYTLDTNYIGIKNVLSETRRNNCRLIHFSTSEVYGDPLNDSQAEDYNGNVSILGPRACYDEGKRVAETLVREFSRAYSLKTTIVRVFNTYGPNMQEDDGRVISNFVTQALKDEDITIYGDGTQTRSFQYIDDLIDAIIKLIQIELPGPINLGCPEEVTILDLAERVLKLIPASKSSIVYKTLPQDDPKRRKPDITLAKKTLIWEPKIDLNTGLANTIHYFKNF